MFIEPREIERILNEVVNRFLIPKFNDLGMKATGEWLQSIEIQAGDNYGTIRARSYSEQLAKGREPGKMPPVEPLKRWVTAKFGIAGKEAASMAWAVAKKIEKSGTSWYEKGGSDLIEVLESPEVLEFIREEKAVILRVQLAEQLIRNAEEALSQ